MKNLVHIRKIVNNTLVSCTQEEKEIFVNPSSDVKYIFLNGEKIYLKHDLKYNTFIATWRLDKPAQIRV